MVKAAVIGFGSMGSMLARTVLEKGFLKPEELVIATRTPSRTDELSARWEGLKTVDNITAARLAAHLFVCVKPSEVSALLAELRPALGENTHIISIAACVSLANLESAFPGEATRVIPSLTSEVFEGISLMCHGSNVSAENKRFVEDFFASISTVKLIAESDFEAASDLTSCAPGLIACIFENFMEAGVRNSALTREEAFDMTVRTLYWTAKLMHDRDLNFAGVIERVATKGGITEEGCRALNAGLPAVFDDLFEWTLAKHESRKAVIDGQFGLL